MNEEPQFVPDARGRDCTSEGQICMEGNRAQSVRIVNGLGH